MTELSVGPTAVRDYFVGLQRDWAVDALRKYCDGVTARGSPLYSGGWFDRLLDADSSNRFTAADLVAVSMLSVTVPPRAAIQLLETRPSDFAARLHALGPDRPIWTAEEDDLTNRGKPIWLAPALELWRSLRELRGVGPVTASKLMAAKRPRLIPVYDKHVQAALGFPTNDFWTTMRRSMIEAHESVTSTVNEAGVKVTELRAVDIVVWMHQHGWKSGGGQVKEPTPLRATT